jgi:hypothetical protein
MSNDENAKKAVMSTFIDATNAFETADRSDGMMIVDCATTI